MNRLHHSRRRSHFDYATSAQPDVDGGWRPTICILTRVFLLQRYFTTIPGRLSMKQI
jgi:hypothetical protein